MSRSPDSAFMENFGKAWDFCDVLEFCRTEENHYPLQKLAIHSVNTFYYALPNAFPLHNENMEMFFEQIEFSYRSNSFHNKQHSIEVLNSMMFLVEQDKIKRFCGPIEILSCIIASVAHDCKHFGV
jgi:hypothetical protein